MSIVYGKNKTTLLQIIHHTMVMNPLEFPVVNQRASPAVLRALQSSDPGSWPLIGCQYSSRADTKGFPFSPAAWNCAVPIFLFDTSPCDCSKPQ